MPAAWLTMLAWVSLGVAFGRAGLILLEVYGRGYRQRMRVMEAVRPVTAPYFGPLAVAAYWRFGRPQSYRWLAERQRDEAPSKPGWASTAVGVSHCGAGCTLGGSASSAPGLTGLLAAHAGRDGDRVRDRVVGHRVADPAWHQGSDVAGR